VWHSGDILDHKPGPDSIALVSDAALDVCFRVWRKSIPVKREFDAVSPGSEDADFTGAIGRYTKEPS
jgi:hypothetical protein